MPQMWGFWLGNEREGSAILLVATSAPMPGPSQSGPNVDHSDDQLSSQGSPSVTLDMRRKTMTSIIFLQR